jgi:hypothetical protein
MNRMVANTCPFNLTLIYSRTEFRFVSVVTKILNIAIFTCSAVFVTVGSYFLNLTGLFLRYYVTQWAKILYLVAL